MSLNVTLSALKANCHESLYRHFNIHFISYRIPGALWPQLVFFDSRNTFSVWARKKYRNLECIEQVHWQPQTYDHESKNCMEQRKMFTALTTSCFCKNHSTGKTSCLAQDLSILVLLDIVLITSISKWCWDAKFKRHTEILGSKIWDSSKQE